MSERIQQEINNLPKQISKQCAADTCVNCLGKETTINELQERIKICEKENIELVKDNKQLKRMLTHSNQINLGNNIKIQELEKKFLKTGK